MSARLAAYLQPPAKVKDCQLYMMHNRDVSSYQQYRTQTINDTNESTNKYLTCKLRHTQIITK